MRVLIVCFLLLNFHSIAQIPKAPDRKEGEGPWLQLIIRGAIMINGTGSPPNGPVDIVIEKNRIVQIVLAGYPGVPINESARVKLK